MPLTAAKIGLRSWRTVYRVRSKAWRCRSQSSLVMLLRCRRSLPTEKARSPAPVRTTTRTAVRTAIVSTISVSSAPISVVIALSACGRFSVITRDPAVGEVVEEHRRLGLVDVGGGGPKSSACPSVRA